MGWKSGAGERDRVNAWLTSLKNIKCFLKRSMVIILIHRD